MFNLVGIVKSQQDSSQLISQASVSIFEGSKFDISSYAFTDNKGVFNLQFEFYDSINYFIVISHIGYLFDTIALKNTNANFLELKVYLKKKIGLLKEVIVKSSPQTDKNDTLEYKADSYKTPETKKVKDLLIKMDGFSVSENGKITYQGKQIKALLINGDDLTQEQYEIVSNNLNANIVDAVQVFDNYNKNKILGSFYKSGDVAINLKIKKKFEGVWSGSSTIGSSFIKRNKADISLVFIKPSLKFLFFGNNNNISENVSGTAFYNEDTYQSKSDFSNFINKEGIIKNSSIGVPDIGNTYTQNINEYFTSPLLHFKINDKINISGKISAAKNLKKYKSFSESKTIIDSQINWSIERNEDLTINQNFLNSSFQINHENKNTLAGLLRFQFFIKRNNTSFVDLSTNAINDTLNELIKNLRFGYGIDYSLTKKLRQDKIFNSNTSILYVPEDVTNELQSKRFIKYFNPLDSSSFFNQRTKINIAKYNTSFYFLNKYNNSILKYGMLINGELNKGTSKTLGYTDKNSKNNYELLSHTSNRNQLSNNYLFSMGYLNTVEKKSIKISLDAGINMNKLNLAIEQNKMNLIYNFATVFSLKKRAFSSKNVTISSVSQLPELSLFYFDKLFNGNSSISILSTSFKPVQYNEVSLSYSKSKIESNGSFFISAFLKNHRADYVNAFRFTKFVNEFYPFLVKGKISTGININAKTYVFPLKSTINFATSMQNEKFNTVINEIVAFESRKSLNYSINYVTNFKLPINTELIINHTLSSGNQLRDNIKLNYFNSFFSIQDKVKLLIQKKIFLGLQYKLIKYRYQKVINQGDLFSTFSINKKVSIDLKLFNVFNLKESVTINNDSNNFAKQNFYLVNRYLLFLVNYTF